MDVSPTSRGSDGLPTGEHLHYPLPGRVLVSGDGPARGPCGALPHGRYGWAAIPSRGHRLPGLARHRSPGEPHHLGVLGLHGSVSGLLGCSERKRGWPLSRYTYPTTNQHSLAYCSLTYFLLPAASSSPPPSPRTHFSPLLYILTQPSSLFLSRV